MYVYRGIINIAIGARVGYVDLDPPQLAGNCVQLLGVTLGLDATSETANKHTYVGLSVKATPRTTLTMSADGIPADLIAGFLLEHSGAGSQVQMNQLLADGFILGNGFVDLSPYALDKLRVIAYLNAAVAAGADVDVAYQVILREVKLNNEIQQELLRKAYS